MVVRKLELFSRVAAVQEMPVFAEPAARMGSRRRNGRDGRYFQRTGTGGGSAGAGAAGAAGAVAVSGLSPAIFSPCRAVHCPAPSNWRPVQFMARPKAEVVSSAALPTAAPARSVRLRSAGAAAGAWAGIAACGAAAGASLADGAPGATGTGGGRLCAKLAPPRLSRSTKIQ